MTDRSSSVTARGGVYKGIHAAEALFGLWQGFSNLQLAVEGGTESARASFPARVDRGIAIFLRAHRV